MSDTNVIQVDGVSFAYDRAGTVLSDATFSITRGDFACFIGPNGGGKTTLVKLLLGLLQPDAGTIRVFGAAPETARPRIGYMPQSAGLDPAFPVTATDVVLMARIASARRIGPYGRDHQRVAADALAAVGLAETGHRPFSSLSGGQRQRVLIARALACEPDLLLLDEPTSNLDLHSQNAFYDLLHELNKRLTLVIVSHDVTFISKYIQTVVCVNHCVDVHAAGEIAGDFVSEMYGHDMRMIAHEHTHDHDHAHDHDHLHK